MPSKKDIEILRELCVKYMSYASLPVQNETRELWYSLNSLDMKRPMVLIDQICWNEIADESLICTVQEPYWRNVEYGLRKKIYQWENFNVDMVLPPYICLPLPVTQPGKYGLSYDIEYKEEKDAVKSQSYTDTLVTEEDIERINPPEIILNQEEKDKIESEAAIIFDGICEYRWQGQIMHLGLWDFVSFAKNVTSCYIDIMDRPEFIHKIMERLTDSVQTVINQYNSLNAFDTSATLCHCSHTFLRDFLNGTNGTTSENAWAFGMAQLFSSASPDVTKEFEVPYMNRLFKNFGAVYYGCCERLDDRLDILDMMPNIRKVSCSPWSERESFAQMLPKKYIMSAKPSPAFLSGDVIDEEAVRKDLRRTINCAKENGIALEMILKDISTVRNNPSRLCRWAQIAKEEVMSF